MQEYASFVLLEKHLLLADVHVKRQFWLPREVLARFLFYVKGSESVHA